MTNLSNDQSLNDNPTFLSQSNISRQGRRLIGGIIILVSVAACLAVASWNIEDPSFTHATGSPVQNLLGFPGAALSDLLLQFLGISTLALIALPAIWGWKFLRLKIDTVTSRQGFLFFIAVLLIAIVASCLPTPASWPLPSGLGGIFGTLILYPFQALSVGETAPWLPWVIAVVFALPLPYVLSKAFSHPSAKSVQKAQSNQTQKSRIKISHGAETTREENDGYQALALGALTHWYYHFKAVGTRMFYGRRAKYHSQAVPQHDLTLEDPAPSPHRVALSTFSNLKKKLLDEPIADDGLGDYLDRVDVFEGEPGFDANLADPTLNEPQNRNGSEPGTTEMRDHSPAPEMQTLKVSDVAPREKPGRRAMAEAQPSFPMMRQPQDYELPPLSFLTEAPAIRDDERFSNDTLTQNAELLEGVLEDFGIKGEIVHVRPGPVVTLYELEPAPGIKSSRVIGLADDIARSMSAIAARVAVIPGKNAIGIELPNQKRETVYLHEALSSKTFENSRGKLPLCLGKTIGGESVIADLARMPHLLVAGTTGSGKSVAINTMILSLLYRFKPDQCKLIMIDPKMLELSVYDGIPHLLTPVVTDPKKAVVALKWTVREMEDRYKKMSKVGVRNIDGFNQRVRQSQETGEPIVRTIQTGYDVETGEAIYEREELGLDEMPYIVVIIDEMADLMMVAGKDIEGAIQRLAQMARAAGIHVIMATQRPSVDVITGTIKANFPTRISFQVTSKIDSRTILGEQGAEQLLGMGDMLYMAGGGRIQRVHGPFVEDGEVEKIVMHLKDQGVPQYLDSITEEVEDQEEGSTTDSGGNVSDAADPYDQAVAVVLRDKKASTSYIQRRLGIGYNRAASIIERMEDEGVVGPANHAGKREILVGSDPNEDFA